MIDRPPAVPTQAAAINRLPTAQHCVCVAIFMCTCLALQNAAYLLCCPSRRGPAALFHFQQKLWELLHKRPWSGFVLQPFSVWFAPSIVWWDMKLLISAPQSNNTLRSLQVHLGQMGKVKINFKGALHWLHTTKGLDRHAATQPVKLFV